MNLAAGSSMLSSHLVRFFIDSANQEVGVGEFLTILAENNLYPLIIDKDHLIHLDGPDAAILYASVQQALRLFYGHRARGILL